jgi:hypothetical protein
MCCTYRRIDPWLPGKCGVRWKYKLFTSNSHLCADMKATLRKTFLQDDLSKKNNKMFKKFFFTFAALQITRYMDYLCLKHPFHNMSLSMNVHTVLRGTFHSPRHPIEITLFWGNKPESKTFSKRLIPEQLIVPHWWQYTCDLLSCTVLFLNGTVFLLMASRVFLYQRRHFFISTTTPLLVHFMSGIHAA